MGCSSLTQIRAATELAPRGCCGLPQTLLEASSPVRHTFFSFFFGLSLSFFGFAFSQTSYPVPPSYSLLSLSSFPLSPRWESTWASLPRRFFLSTRNTEKECGFALWVVPRHVSDHLWKEHCIPAALRQHLTNRFQNLHPAVFRDS